MTGASFLDQELLREQFEGKFKSARVGFPGAYFFYGDEKIAYTTHAMAVDAVGFVSSPPIFWLDRVFNEWLEKYKPEGNTVEGLEPMETITEGRHLVWRKTPQIIYQEDESGKRRIVFFCRFATVTNPALIREPVAE